MLNNHTGFGIKLLYLKKYIFWYKITLFFLNYISIIKYLDVASKGEIKAVLKLGASPDKIVLSNR